MTSLMNLLDPFLPRIKLRFNLTSWVGEVVQQQSSQPSAPGVNFTNVLQAAITLVVPKSVKLQLSQ